MNWYRVINNITYTDVGTLLGEKNFKCIYGVWSVRMTKKISGFNITMLCYSPFFVKCREKQYIWRYFYGR
jgi:hypothetical protein